LIWRKCRLLICRNEIRLTAAKNAAMRADPSSEPEIDGLGHKRGSLSTILATFIVLVGIVAMVAILIAYGLMGML
jgi:hypothetical protein